MMSTRVCVFLAVMLAITIPVLAANEIWVLRIDDEIGPATVTYLREGLNQAEAAEAALVVLVLSTPGGLLDSGVSARNVLLDTTVHTVAFVDREALSAGALLAISCEQIIFAPGGVLGAATPFVVSNDVLREAPEKTISAMRKMFRATAELYGRPLEVAEAMVDRDISIPDLVEQGKLLTLTAQEAAQWGYSDGTAESIEAWLESTAHAGAAIITYEPRWIDGVISVLTLPLVAGIMIAVGLLGLIIEMLIPGFGVFGLIGILCLGAFFWSHVLVGLAGWESIVFLIGGFIAILLEIFAFTAVDFGLAGLVGLVLIGLGFYTSMLGPLASSAQAAQALIVVVVGLVASIVAIVILITKLPKTRLRLGGMILSTAITGRAFSKSQAERTEKSWVGRSGVAATDLHPVGAGDFDGERADVVCEEGFLPKGTPITIIKDEGYRKVVQREIR
ncbi:nodulation protein NfeD [Candidatus Bipolaricaulota bacterium]